MQVIFALSTLICVVLRFRIKDLHPFHIQYSFYLSVARPAGLPPLPSPPRGRTPDTLRTSIAHRSIAPEPPLSGPRPLSRAPTPVPSSRTAFTSHPPSSPRTHNDNFILPSDVDENGHLVATVTTFPRNALKIMRDWKEHLSLHLLTPDSIQEYNRRPSADIQYAQTSSNGSLTLVTKAPDNDAEYLLSETQWRRAIPTYLRLITHHCNRPNRMQIVHGLQQHFDRIMAMPDYYDEFLLYLRYDIQIRGLVATQKYVPTGWEPNIFDATLRK